MRARPGRFVVIAAATALLAGCTGGSDDPEPTGTPTHSPITQETSGGSPEPTGTSGAPGPREFPDEPLAATPSSEPGVTIEVFELVRTDGAVHLTFALVLDEDADAQASAYPLVGGVTTTDARNVTLFDPVGLKRYLAYMDEDDRCLCSSAHHFIKPGERRFYSVLFPEPPDDVSRLTVEMPAGSVAGVPLSAA